MVLLTKSDALEIHRRTIEAHGGAPGLRDEGALESAIAAVLNRIAYDQADVAACAATYAYHLAQAHAFVDGNKRVAAVTMLAFLVANGASVAATESELEALILEIAAGARDRDRVESWLRRRVRTTPAPDRSGT